MTDRQADTSHLAIVSESPFNAEARLDGLEDELTPAGRHYVRNHFAVPAHPGTLAVDGAVAHPLVLAASDLAARATRTLTVTLECAGNGRRYLDPPAPGEQWALGAVGTARWNVLPLREVIEEAGLASDAVELVFAGADSGLVGALGATIGFERSIPVGDIDGAWLATGMNGEPLTPNHGAPVRLLVPGRYGMASVKWLARITAVTTPFRGFFQADRYVIDGRPLGAIAPRAVIAAPAHGDEIPIGGAVIRGYAWSGTGPVISVSVSADAGETWRDAVLGPSAAATAWRAWAISWHPTTAGEAVILARATDAAGRTQPLEQVRNDLGYGNNQARATTVRVVE